MAQDQKKRLQKLLKKRQKDKARKKQQAAPAPPSSRNMVQKARQFPIIECIINHDWDASEDSGLVRIVLARQGPEDSIIFGTYMVDMYCLGLKDTHSGVAPTRAQFDQEIVFRLFQDGQEADCPIDLAHQIIYQAIDYAAQFGFKPQKDFRHSQFVLEKRGTLPEQHHLTFGKDGKPLYIAGPYDNARAIVARLEQKAGSGNYNYLVALSPPGMAAFADEDDEEFDEDDEELDDQDETDADAKT
jgi:hypothetical protein